jgi:hypothetical protein
MSEHGINLPASLVYGAMLGEVSYWLEEQTRLL